MKGITSRTVTKQTKTAHSAFYIIWLMLLICGLEWSRAAWSIGDPDYAGKIFQLESYTDWETSAWHAFRAAIAFIGTAYYAYAYVKSLPNDILDFDSNKNREDAMYRTQNVIFQHFLRHWRDSIANMSDGSDLSRRCDTVDCWNAILCTDERNHLRPLIGEKVFANCELWHSKNHVDFGFYILVYIFEDENDGETCERVCLFTELKDFRLGYINKKSSGSCSSGWFASDVFIIDDIRRG